MAEEIIGALIEAASEAVGEVAKVAGETAVEIHYKLSHQERPWWLSL